MFFRGSRYASVEDAETQDTRGRMIRYKQIRFIPETTAVRVHTVTGGERLDQIAHRYFRDAQRFWRIADTNLVLWPEDLTAESGKSILIPPPED